jgi:hypothetical protein
MKLTDQSIGFLTALLANLQEQFPDSIPINTSPSLEEFRRLQGHQEVIQYIKNLKAGDGDEDNPFEED